MKRGEKRKNQETEGGNLTYQMEEHGKFVLVVVAC